MTYDPPKGYALREAARSAVIHAKLNLEEVEFTFNGTKVTATPFSHPDDVVEIWELRRRVDNLRWRLGETACFTS